MSQERTREKRRLRKKSIVCGKQSGFRGVLGVASKREKRRLRKKVQCVETVALEACSCVEASERERNEGFVKRLSFEKRQSALRGERRKGKKR